MGFQPSPEQIKAKEGTQRKKREKKDSELCRFYSKKGGGVDIDNLTLESGILMLTLGLRANEIRC